MLTLHLPASGQSVVRRPFAASAFLAIVSALFATGVPGAAAAPSAPQGSGLPGAATVPGTPAAGIPEPQEAPGGDTASVGGFALAGVPDRPTPPLPPAVVTRDAQGRASVRAVRLATGIRLDGVLDEPAYEAVPAISDFVQQMPVEGAPATEKTEAWILFDEENIYVSGRAWDSAPPGEWVANEMRRDTPQLRENDSFWVAFDTFNDRRNGVAFYTNALGAIGDFGITNEGNPNGDWNPVWDVRTGRFDGGWTVEMEIPFKSLRYRPGPLQQWGVQIRRLVRRKNEQTYITSVPIAAGRRGFFRMSDAALLVGLDVPDSGTNLEIKPYGISGVTTDLTLDEPRRNDGDGDFGVDVKYGITRNLTADLTWNTDFAQVEVDEQQVNLTRFNLFFPEKREFFLENRGIFDFARGGGPSLRDGALRLIGSGRSSEESRAPTLFYSRRIGLQEGAVVPIVGGGRVTGKVGAFDVGALSMQADDAPNAGVEATHFTVARIKRDILRRSAVGALFTNRSVSLAGDGASQTLGADGTFSFYENVSAVAYLARTRTPGRQGRDMSYQGQLTWNGDRYGFQADHLTVEDNFRPEVGFWRRENFRRSFGSARFSPRPASIDAIRQFRLEGAFDYVEAADTGFVETRQTQLAFLTELENSDRIGISAAENYEFLVEPFEPGRDVVLPVGGYRFRDLETTYTLGGQRRLSGVVTVRTGEYYNGTIRSVGFRRARFVLVPQLAVEPTVSVNWIDTPQGSFRADLLVSRITWTLSPRMFFSGLVQYNSSTRTVSNNLRLRWEYSPGSELFVVYTEDRDSDPLRPDRFSASGLRNRGLVVKVNRLFRF